MDEQQIVENLRKNIPKPYETNLAPKQEPETNTGQATDDSPYDLSELAQYKLHDYFGEQYNETDEDSKQQIRYIYETIGVQIGSTDYMEILTKVREIERIAGTAHSDNRIYRLYQWLKLDNIRRRTEQEMSLIGSAE